MILTGLNNIKNGGDSIICYDVDGNVRNVVDNLDFPKDVSVGCRVWKEEAFYEFDGAVWNLVE